MTKKHYTAISDAISKARDGGGDGKTLEKLASELSEFLKADNPNFNEKIFLKACGISRCSGLQRGSALPDVAKRGDGMGL